MNKLHKITKGIMGDSIKWVNGTTTGGNYEKLFQLRLEQGGFTKFPEKLTGDALQTLKAMIHHDDMKDVSHEDRYKNPIPDILPNNWYIEQPFGSQNYPDFIIAENGAVLAVELKKTTKGSNPMWNGGLPRVNGLYIFMRLQPSDVTTFMGNTVISDERFNAMKCFDDEVQKALHEHKKLLKILDADESGQVGLDRGFIIRPRAAYDQLGAVSNYFNHNGRTLGEKSTLQQIKDLKF